MSRGAASRMTTRWLAAALVMVSGAAAGAPASAQSRVATDVDTTLIHVGDRVTMTVSVEHPAGATVAWPDSVDVSPFEVLGARALPPETTPDGTRSRAVITLTAFELGELEIPPFEVAVTAPDGSTEVLSTDRFAVAVESVGTDETGDIRDIRGVLGIPISVVRVGLWGLLAIIAVALVFGAYRLTRRRGDVEAPQRPAAPPRPAHEIALEALARLEASPMLERGQVKEYHIEVSDILRRYVERRFRVDALEMTTREVVAGLSAKRVDQGFSDGLGRFLDACDMVKFAKVRPDADASRAVLALGRELVESTIPRELEPEGESGPVSSGALPAGGAA